MQNAGITEGTLAFVGPTHVRGLEGFTYLSVVRIHGTTAIVRKTGPDASQDSPEFDVKVSILRHRVVESTESDLWPGSYVGHPIAFVQPAGPTSDQWEYGLVTGYGMHGNDAYLHVLHGTVATRVRLTSSSAVIAVDRLNYALRTGASINATVVNAHELLDKQNQVIVVCGKSRSGLPATVTSTMLSVPFNPDERVPLIKPDTLEIVHVRRQHIIDCELTARGSTPADVFKDPSSTAEPSTATMDASRAPHSTDLSFSDTDDEGKSNAAPTEQADIDAVRLQNRHLRKRTRADETPSPDLLLQDGDDAQAFEPRSDNHASSFRLSQVEQQVHSAIVHPNLQGKNAQAVLESAQQGPRTKFLVSPPVLRAVYDMSFGIRGLSLMHFRRFYEAFDSQTTTGLCNMTNFGRSNTLQPAAPPASIAEILDAFDTLLHFAKGFYNTTAYNFFKTGARFMEKYAALTRPDIATCAMLVFWINSKFGKFRSEVVTSDLRTAALVGQEVFRNDDHLMERLQSQQDRRVAALLAPKPDRPASTHRPGPRASRVTQNLQQYPVS
jgi:hypothetical protein